MSDDARSVNVRTARPLTPRRVCLSGVSVASTLVLVFGAATTVASRGSTARHRTKSVHCKKGYVRRRKAVKRREHGRVVKVQNIVCVRIKPKARASPTTTPTAPPAAAPETTSPAAGPYSTVGSVDVIYRAASSTEGSLKLTPHVTSASGVVAPGSQCAETIHGAAGESEVSMWFANAHTGQHVGLSAIHHAGHPGEGACPVEYGVETPPFAHATGECRNLYGEGLGNPNTAQSSEAVRIVVNGPEYVFGVDCVIQLTRGELHAGGLGVQVEYPGSAPEWLASQTVVPVVFSV